MTKTPKQVVHVRLDQDAVRALRSIGQSHDLSIGVLVREAVAQWLQNPTFTRRPTGAADAEGVE